MPGPPDNVFRAVRFVAVVTFCVLTTLDLTTRDAHAQSARLTSEHRSSVSVYVAGEVVRPMGPTPFIERWEAAVGGAGGLGFRMPFRRELELVLWGAHSTHGLEGADLLGDLGFDSNRATIEGGTITVQALALRLRYLFEEGARWYPYVFVEGGMHRSRFADVTVRQDGATFADEGGEETVLGLGFGGGLQVPVYQRWSAVFEGSYTVAFNRDLFRNGNGDSDLVYRLPIRLGVAVAL